MEEQKPIQEKKVNVPEKERERSKEGIIFNRWLYNRMIKSNKNVLSAVTGPTGSAKSYQDLKRAELWYRYHFNEEFPRENICFSVSEVIRRVSSKKLRKGEILIFEEAGANLGSLDFQNKVCKMFTYVLQSFRSMNIAIFFNLPYLSMLNKQARLLIHVHFMTKDIDQKKKLSKSKGFFRQVNQSNGKVYSKYMWSRVNNKITQVKEFSYSLPSKQLIKTYELKKLNFLSKMTYDFGQELDKIEHERNKKEWRKDLTEKQARVYELAQQGLVQREIGKIMETSTSNICEHLQAIRKKGYLV